MENHESNNSISGLQDFLKKVGIQACDSNFKELEHCLAEASSSKAEEGASRRWQDSVIESLIESGQAVLDIGCGEGDLMARLVKTRQARVQGLELNQEMVLRCIERGLPVYHGNLENSLQNFCDKSYDFVILEETLQTLQKPLEVLKEMLRVGKKCIVSFPNFAHWNVRLALGLGGRMPRTESLPNTWYNTPNIHLCSINDFLDWTKEIKVTIIQGYVLVNGIVTQYADGHNLTAEQAMFILEK